jgi:tRNA-specific 2-thiouridylase
MIEEYRRGRTPNPDVMCNREVKFGACMQWVKKQDSNALFATGHYAQGDTESLIQGNDNNKDQTYFLWAIKKELLPSIIFPIGRLEKNEVRRIAKEANLPVAEKRDSQGLCFVGTIDVKTLLKQYIDEKKGHVLDEYGEVIGHHTGAMFYTLGERHGFTITKKSVSDAPYFVIAKNMETNTITVSHTPPQEDTGDVIVLEDVNWMTAPHNGRSYQARARYRAPFASVEIIDDTHIMVADGDITRTPGQSLVLYDNERCIGGGIMK